MSETARLGLPLLQPAQAQKHVTVNEALGRLDGMVQAVVEGAGAASPPANATDGQAFIVAAPGSGAWSGWAGDIALRAEGGWLRLPTATGWRVWSRADGTLLVRTQNGWLPLGATLGVLELTALGTGAVKALGVNAATDATNSFVFRGTNALFQSEGAIDATLNKAGAADDASVTFKTGYAPRALMGLLGNDDFTLKSGERFVEAMRINRHSGRAVFRKIEDRSRRFDAVGRNRIMGGAWSAVAVPSGTTWAAIAWAEDLGRFAALARTSDFARRAMTSPDGLEWVSGTTPGDDQWSAVARAPELGLFVAVASSGSGGRVMTSPDGATWSAGSAPARGWSAVAWSGELGLFAAVAASGTGNRIMTSPDGVVWTLRTSPALAWQSVCWAAELGLFVAVASSGSGARAMTSADGVVWTLRDCPDATGWRSVVWAAELGLIVAVGADGTGPRAMTSPDGIAWTPREVPEAAWHSVAWAPEAGLLSAVAADGPVRGMVSTDAVSWQPAPVPAAPWRAIAWAPGLGRFAALADGGEGARGALSAEMRPAGAGPRGTTGVVVFDAGRPETDFSVGVSINCGGVI